MVTATVDRLASALREENEQLRRENNALKTDIAYWKSRHHDAVEREEALKKALADKEARIKYLNRQLYGKKNERSNSKPEGGEQDTAPAKRGRGQQPGRPIPPPRDQSHLPVHDELYELPDSELFCPNCGLPVEDMPDTEDSMLIETLEVRGYQRRIRRKK